MSEPGSKSSPTPEDGSKRLLNFFLYGMLRASETLGTPAVFVRTVIEESLSKFLTQFPSFPDSEDATETCAAFTKAADQSGLFDGSDTLFRGDANTVSVEIGDRCPYRSMCTVRHDEGQPVHCIRTYVLAEMLRIRLKADFDWKLTRFGRPCHITLARSRWGQS